MQGNENLNRIRLIRLLLKILPLIPRAFSIFMYVNKALKIKNEDRLSIGRVLEHNAIKFSDKNAVLFEDRIYTHRQFNAIVNQYANYFLSVGLGRGEVVVLYMENGPEMLFLVAALAKLGAIASIINANQKGKALVHSIHLDPGSHFVVDETLLPRFKEIKDKIRTAVPHKFYWQENTGRNACPQGYIDLQKEIANHQQHNPFTTRSIVTEERFANIFTSGTTGMPKAAIQTHRKWMQLYYWFGKVNMNLSSNDVIYVPIPFFHSNALMIAWTSAAASGAALAIRRKYSTTGFWKDIQKFQASAFIYIGEICRYLLNAPGSEEEKQHKVRKIVGNGLRPEIWKDFKKRFGINTIIEFYGAAEGNIAFTNTFNMDNTVGWTPVRYAIVKYDIMEGKPTVCQQGFFERVKVGEAGLLLSHVNNNTPLLGYVKSEDTEKKVFRNVFKKGDVWFNTGDLIRDIGYRHVQFVDRLGDTFRWKGENVSTTEVEKIVNRVNGVLLSTAYGVKIPGTDGRAGMVAIQTASEWSKGDLEKFLVALREELPAYAIPVFVRFCKMFETTATQKIKKTSLKEEAYNIDQLKDDIFILLPRTACYVKLDKTIYRGINNYQYEF